jgi:dienelactone hydrolase
MITPLFRALRFARRWSVPRSDLVETDISIPGRGGREPNSGTLVSLPGSRPRAGWVVLHGITRPGRRHPGLLRFVRALASTGGRVLVPEVAAWTELRFEPGQAQKVLDGAVRWMADSSACRPGGVVLLGFSFGGPQALLAASDPDLGSRLRGVVSWGGYQSLDRTVAFQFTGEHELDGRTEVLRPDPYGRWVVGANCLLLTPGYHDRHEVAGALHRLAAEAGERQLPPLDPGLDPLKSSLRSRLGPDDRRLFDLFAPPWDRDPDPESGRELAGSMVAAARQKMPLLDPIPGIDSIRPPVRLLHGRTDRLIPYTETLYLARTLSSCTRNLDTRLTGLFAHSGGSERLRVTSRAREAIRFLRMLAGVFELDG